MLIKNKELRFDATVVKQKDFPSREAWLREVYRINMDRILSSGKVSELKQQAMLDEDQYVDQVNVTVMDNYNRDLKRATDLGIPLDTVRKNYIEAAEDAIGGFFTDRQERLGVNIYTAIQKTNDPTLIGQLEALVPKMDPYKLKATNWEKTFIYDGKIIIHLGDHNSLTAEGAYIRRLSNDQIDYINEFQDSMDADELNDLLFLR